MRLYSPDITKPTEVNYYWHEKVLIEPMPKPKQGEWTEMYRNGFGNMIYMCSKCSFHASRSRYCPNCGARMKGADDD